MQPCTTILKDAQKIDSLNLFRLCFQFLPQEEQEYWNMVFSNPLSHKDVMQRVEIIILQKGHQIETLNLDVNAYIANSEALAKQLKAEIEVSGLTPDYVVVDDRLDQTKHLMSVTNLYHKTELEIAFCKYIKRKAEKKNVKEKSEVQLIPDVVKLGFSKYGDLFHTTVIEESGIKKEVFVSEYSLHRLVQEYGLRSSRMLTAEYIAAYLYRPVKGKPGQLQPYTLASVKATFSAIV